MKKLIDGVLVPRNSGDVEVRPETLSITITGEIHYFYTNVLVHLIQKIEGLVQADSCGICSKQITMIDILVLTSVLTSFQTKDRTV